MVQTSIDTAQTAGTTAPESVVPVPATKKRRGHLYELDIVRIVTFAGVIFDHCVSGTNAAGSIASNSVQMVFHYTRNAFFALTGFVLVYQYRDRELVAKTFWRHRFKLIGLPYVSWTIFYWLYGIYAPPFIPPSTDHYSAAFGTWGAAVNAFTDLGYDLVTGSAWYHLYFIFVTMQVYLFFPLLLRFLRWSWGYHRYVLAASFVLHLALLQAITVRPGVVGEVLWLPMHHTVFPYQFYTLAGAIAALHVEAFRAWIVRWRGWVLLATVALVILAGAYYLRLVGAGIVAESAAGVFRPYATFMFVGIVLSLYAAGTIWSERRTRGSFWDTFLAKASDRSFGIFLVHALALQMLAPTIHLFRFDVYPPIVTGVTFVAVVVLTVAIVEALRRTPLSLFTTGREMMPRKKKPAVLEPAS